MNARKPKYAEIYSELRRAILKGTFPSGSFLPTENELTKQYNASKTTIRHAVKLLRDHDFVEVRQGCGTRVLPVRQKAVTTSKYRNPSSQVSVEVRYRDQGPQEVHNTCAVIDRLPAGETVASALGIPAGAPVYRIQRLQLADGIVFGYMVNYIAESLVPDLPSKGELMTDLYGQLSKLYGIHILEIRETVDAITASFMESQYLQVDIGAPLILLRRTALGEQGPAEYCETTVRPDVFHMTVKMSPRAADGQIS